MSLIEYILFCYYEKEIAYELELKSLLFNLFSILYKNNLINKQSTKSSLTFNTTDKIKIILNYINEHFAEDISINTLATLCDYSEYTLCDFLKNI